MKGHRSGFTIVELLIVIVIIAILAAITIVAYNGITQRSQSAAVQSTVAQALKKVKAYAVTNEERYPTSVNACPSPGVTELCLSPGTNATAVYAVENNAAPAGFCYSVSTSRGEFYTDESGAVLPGSCAQQSCYRIQQTGGSHGSGTYWIQPTGVGAPIRAYCDMDTSGGGWTLLVNNVGPSTSWSGSTVWDRNRSAPSLTGNYSILQYANDIKADFGGKLNYRMDAVDLGRWGGVWEAPFSANLEGTSVQNVANLTQKYDAWTQDTDPNDTNGTQTPSNVVPWVSSSGSVVGLVTWGGSGNWWGTAVTYSGWNPAPWMAGVKQDPGVIRYWVK